MKEELLKLAKDYLDNVSVEQLKQDLNECWIDGPRLITSDELPRCVIYWLSRRCL